MEMLYEFEFEEEDMIGESPKEDLDLFLDILDREKENVDIDAIVKGFNLCIEFHSGQVRASGKPYYLHPVKVAMILIQEFEIYDNASVITCLLHDAIEDTNGETEEDREMERARRRRSILDSFPEIVQIGPEKRTLGEEILEMVEAVTKIKHSRTSKIEDQADTHRKLFLALVHDVRVILVKLADRMHNMRTLHYLREEKRHEIAHETLNFYTPFAHRLGLNRIKMELEDRSLYFTDRNAYEAIRTALAEKRRDFMEYIRIFSQKIEDKLRENKIDYVLTIVHKHIYEIYRMMENGKTISEIDNFYSMVITTDSNDKFECYKVHGILVNAFNPVNHMIDYIAQPKINFYQSLNTQLFGPDGKLVDVIIRTAEMDKLAEGGITSNFSLSEGRVRALEIGETEIEDWGEWMEDMIEERGDEAIQIIWNSIKNNIFDNEVRVFTPDGELIKLPKRACPIDFAFAVSENLGLHCISAKVNGEIKELNYELMNGDVVYIISSPNQDPLPEWQNFVISHLAEVKLHHYFKEHPHKRPHHDKKAVNFDVRLMIKGEDRPGMLKEITTAIDQTNISRISLDSSDTDFSGAINLRVKDNMHLNNLFAKLFSIKGIKSVEQIDVNGQ